MNSLILVAAIIGCCVAYPQRSRNVVIHKAADPNIAYEFHDVHQSPIPAIRQTHVQSDYQVPVQPSRDHTIHPVSSQTGYVHQQGARSASYRQPVAILAMNQEATYDGNFNFGFQSEDGIQTKTSGTVRSIEGSEFPAQVMKGSYSYTAPDGTQVVTNWYADETGFHAEGDHIPSTPDAIQRSVEYLRSLPPVKEEPQLAGKY